MAAIGIDLGTTNCCVSVVRNGVVEIIPNDIAKNTTPSFIGFEDEEIKFGLAARKMASRKAENVIYDVKRFIGLPFNDGKVQENIRDNRWPFHLVSKNGRIKICITRAGKMEYYSPEEISGALLKELKSHAEQFLQTEVSHAVITVPTHFSDAQRQSTIDAGKLAGFSSIRILNEPTAAAVAYGTYNNIKEESKYLIFDFGGGTFDVSIIKHEDDIYDVLAIDGDLNLGGVDIDHNLMDHFLEKTKMKLDKRKVYRLSAACESAKIDFSSMKEVDIEIDDNEVSLNIDTFNLINAEMFHTALAIVNNCINRAKQRREDISHIVLVGGSTRILKISQLLTEYFKKPVKCNINPDEAVAMGAAIIAAKEVGQFRNLKLNNICPYSLGVEIKGGKMHVLIPKYTKIPTKETQIFKAGKKGQDTINVKVYAGENEYISKNKFLANFKISGLKSSPDGHVHETFCINENGVLEVSATSGELTRTINAIPLESGNLTSDEVLQFKSKLEENFVVSKQTKTFNRAKNDLEDMAREDKLDNQKVDVWLAELRMGDDKKRDLQKVINEIKLKQMNKK